MTRGANGDYVSIVPWAAWKVWQAARQAPASGEVKPAGWRKPSVMRNDGWGFTADRKRAENWAIVSTQVEPVFTHPPAKVPEGWKPSVSDYDHGIHTNPDAKEWADFFMATLTEWVKRTGVHHDLKTDSSVFRQSIAGLKPWEIRRNDRGFSVGDTVTLRETENTGKEMAEGAPLVFTGRTVSGVIVYVLKGPVYGLSDEWCIFTLQATPPQEQ